MPIEHRGDGTVRITHLDTGEVIYEGPGRIVYPVPSEREPTRHVDVIAGSLTLEDFQPPRPPLEPYDNDLLRPEEMEAERVSDLRLWREVIEQMAAREVNREVILEMYGLTPRPEYDELIASTRAEFPPDRWGYGLLCPSGPMHWTPPADGEEVPRWLA